MKRSFIAGLVISLAPLAAHARSVDIGDARALDALSQENPAQFARVAKILRVAGDVSCETLPLMLKVQFNARDVECNGALILTSFPAKRHIAFKLEDTSFAGNVVITGKPATLRRAKPSLPSNPRTPLTPP
jgi:hypothetical protein